MAIKDKDIAINTNETSHLRYRPWDFRKLQRISHLQEQALNCIFQDYTQRLKIKLSELLKTDVTLEIESICQSSANKYLLSLPDPTFFSTFELYPYHCQGSIETNPTIVYTVINQLLGNDPRTPLIGHALNDLETGLARKFFNILLHELRFSWEPLATITFSIRDMQSYIPSSLPYTHCEMCLSLFMRLQIKNIVGMVTLCFPLKTLLNFAHELDLYAQAIQESHPPEKVVRPSVLSQTEVKAKAVLGSVEMSLQDFQSLKLGDILDLGRSAYQSIDLLINGQHTFKATPALSGRFKSVLLQQVILKE